MEFKQYFTGFTTSALHMTSKYVRSVWRKCNTVFCYLSRCGGKLF